MLKNFLLIPFSLRSIVVTAMLLFVGNVSFSQVRPDQAPTKSPADTDEIYTQYLGVLNRIKFSDAKVYFQSGLSLSWNSATNELTIGGGNTVDISSLNTDDQQLTRDGLILSLENGGSVDLSPLFSGIDDQTLSFNSATGELTIQDGNTVDLSPLESDGSETKINAGTNVTITGSGTVAAPYVVNASGSGGSTQVATISDLSSLTPSDNDRIYVQGYYSEFDGGEGYLYYDANKAKSEANAGSIIDPSNFNSWDGTQANFQSTMLDATNGQGGSAVTGNGVWVRESLTNTFTTGQFGILADSTLSQELSLENSLESIKKGETIIASGVFINFDRIINLQSGVSIKSLDTFAIVIDTMLNINNGFIVGQSNTNIEGITLISRVINNTQGSMIRFDNASNVVIKKCSTKGHIVSGVELRFCDNTQVENNKLNQHQYAIRLSACDNVTTRKNIMSGNLRPPNISSAVPYGEGVKYIGVSGTTSTNIQHIDDIYIDLGRDGIDITGGCENCTIEKCKFIRNGTGGIDLKSTFGSEGFSDEITGNNAGWLISDCIFENASITFDVGYKVQSNPSVYVLDSLEYWMTSMPTIIDGCVFKNGGINSFNASDIQVSDCMFWGNTASVSFRNLNFGGASGTINKGVNRNIQLSNISIVLDTVDTDDIFTFEDYDNVKLDNIHVSIDSVVSNLTTIELIGARDVNANKVDYLVRSTNTGITLDLIDLRSDTRDVNINNIYTSCINNNTTNFYSVLFNNPNDCSNVSINGVKGRNIDALIAGNNAFAGDTLIVSNLLPLSPSVNTVINNTPSYYVDQIITKTDRVLASNTLNETLDCDGEILNINTNSAGGDVTLSTTECGKESEYIFVITGSNDVIFPSKFDKANGTDVGTLSKGTYRFRYITDAFVLISSQIEVEQELNKLTTDVATITASSTTISANGGSKYSRYHAIDMTSASTASDVTLSLTTTLMFTGSTYTFHFKNTQGSHNVVFPAFFKNMDGTAVGTIAIDADQQITGYFDGTDFYCETGQ